MPRDRIAKSRKKNSAKLSPFARRDATPGCNARIPESFRPRRALTEEETTHESNQGYCDRALRIVLGLGLLTLTVIGPQTPWGLLRLIPLGNGAVGVLPALSDGRDDHVPEQKMNERGARPFGPQPRTPRGSLDRTACPQKSNELAEGTKLCRSDPGAVQEQRANLTPSSQVPQSGWVAWITTASRPASSTGDAPPFRRWFRSFSSRLELGCDDRSSPDPGAASTKTSAHQDERE